MVNGVIASIVVLLVTGGLLIGFGLFFTILFPVMSKETPKPLPQAKAGRAIVNTGAGRRTYAEGRPTMPSTEEPESERARRRAAIRNIAQDAVDQGVYGMFIPTVDTFEAEQREAVRKSQRGR
jgi:hypothetical protein